MKIMIDCRQRCMHLRSMVAITVALILLMRMSTQHVDGIPTTGMLHKLRSVDSGRARSLGIALSGRCVRHPMARSRLKVAWVNLTGKRPGIHSTAVALVLRARPQEATRRTPNGTFQAEGSLGRIRRQRGETAVALVLQACSQETMLWTPYTERSGCAPYGPSCRRVYDLLYDTIRTSPVYSDSQGLQGRGRRRCVADGMGQRRECGRRHAPEAGRMRTSI
ncbi:predicted protein [Postia placenta Mad-698-R]|nr:predicted protein [Postia placenta Mad-698-R]